MGSTVYDWSPFFQALQGTLGQLAQQKQYNDLIGTLSGQPSRPGLFSRLLLNPAGQQPQPAPGAVPAPQQQVDTQMPAGAPVPAQQPAQSPAPGAGLNFDLLRRLPPGVGMPLLLQMVQSQLTPQAPVIAHPGDVGFDRQGRQIFAVPAAPDYGEKGVGINPATGKQEVYQLDKKTGKPSWTGITPGPSIDFVNGQAVDKTTGQPLPVAPIPKQAEPYRPLSQQELNDKVALTRAEAEARQKAQRIDDDTREAQAQAIANYQQAPLSSFAISKPDGAATMARVMQINPDYRAQNYEQSRRAQIAFGNGPQGNQVRSLNVAISHLNTLDRLADALGNGNVQAFNSIKNAFREQFGGEAPTNFDAAKAIVGDEVVKAVIGGGGALADREEAKNKISAAKSWDQLRGVTRTYRELMAGQMQGLRQQFKNATMLGDKEFDQKLSPETMTELKGLVSSSGVPTPPVAPSGALPAGWSVKVK